MVSSSTVSGSSRRVAVQVAQLAHAVAHRLRVHEQLGGDVLAAAVVQQPGAQGVGELLGVGGSQVGERRERPRAQVGEGLGVGGQHQPGRWSSVSPESPAASARRARSYDARTCEPRTGRPGDAPAVGRAVASRRGPAATVRVGHQQQRPARRGRAGPRRPGASRRAARRAAAAPGPPARSPPSASRAAPTRPARPPPGRARGSTVEQVGGEPLEQPLAHPPGGGQLVGVPGHARGRQLVDVGEHQLGEAGQGVGRRCPPRTAVATSRATPPGRRSGRPAAGRRSSGRCAPHRGRAGRRPPWPARSAYAGRLPRVPGGQREEAAQRELHGVADVLAHAARSSAPS